MGFTDEQIRAYQAKDNNFLISAGAGSGKTSVLSERVRYLIREQNYHIEDFLILTFTNAAAAEMKERIRQKLEEDASPEAEKIDASNICTFDSYSLFILKKYHYYKNLSKDISIVDSNTCKVLIYKKIDDILDKMYLNKDPLLISFLETYSFRSDDRLKEVIYDLFSHAKNCVDLDTFLNTISNSNNKRMLNSYLMAFSNNIDNLVQNLIFNLSTCNDQKYVDGLNLLLQPYFESNGIDDKVVSLKNINLKKVRNTDKEFDSKNLVTGEIKKIKKFINRFDTEDDYFNSAEESSKYNLMFVDIVKQLLDYDLSFKREMQAYEFIDVAKMAIEIFKENPDIKEEIKNSLKTIMIDEYQDTSPIQEEFISLISNKNVYVVGDVKQSIYRFRNATPEIFIDKFNKYKNRDDGELIVLTNNFRSRSEVLNGINKMFSNIMTEALGGANYKVDHIINAGNKTYDVVSDRGQNYDIESLCYDLSIFDSDLEIHLIAQDIIKKVNEGYKVLKGKDNPHLEKVKFSDFCILLDRGTIFYKIEKIFKEYQIPLYVENNADISNSHIVLIICNLLKLLFAVKNNQFDESILHPYISFARSFVIGYDDETIYNERKLPLKEMSLIRELIKWYEEHKSLSTYDLIIELIHYFKIYEKLTEVGDVRLNEKYLDSFLVSIKAMTELNYDLETLINHFDKIKELELKIDIPSTSSEFDAVTLMNIFKSKGLEFPIIYCMGLGKSFNDVDSKKLVYYNQDIGLLYRNKKQRFSFIYDYLSRKEKLADLSEKIRLIYVALTRAKEKVYILFPSEYKRNAIEDSSHLGNLISYAINDTRISLVKFDENIRLEDRKINVEEKKLNYEEFPFTPILKTKTVRASKKLSFSSQRQLLLMGEKLHSYLECLDFNNPDFSIIGDQNHKDKIMKFFTLNLWNDLDDVKFYKEYEFIDEINNARGIIDLLIVSKQKIMIIDYKLKRIDDEKYKDQLRVYYNYVNSYFHRTSECYLYSIIDGELNRVVFE